MIEKSKIQGRYITLSNVEKALNLPYETIGKSVKGKPIIMYRVGWGRKKILMWSQMHGNESTTTKAVVDFIDYANCNSDAVFLQKCSVYIIPILNPDGAEAYTRENANHTDLNRDALQLSQPETQALFNICEKINPDFCFNLHDQRSIFSVEQKPYPATLSFLAPCENNSRDITSTRKKSMEVISYVYQKMKKRLAHQMGRFDDSFNPHCTGDRFTQKGIPTILFEAGHFQNDYERESTRKFVFEALLNSVMYISEKEYIGEHYSEYFLIPENEKRFLDVIIFDDISEDKCHHIGIVLKDRFIDNRIVFQPLIEIEGDMQDKVAHQYMYLSQWFSQYDKEKIKEFIMLYSFVK